MFKDFILNSIQSYVEIDNSKEMKSIVLKPSLISKAISRAEKKLDKVKKIDIKYDSDLWRVVAILQDNYRVELSLKNITVEKVDENAEITLTLKETLKVSQGSALKDFFLKSASKVISTFGTTKEIDETTSIMYQDDVVVIKKKLSSLNSTVRKIIDYKLVGNCRTDGLEIIVGQDVFKIIGEAIVTMLRSMFSL